MTHRVFFLNGPNANLYGLDPSGTYGKNSFAEIRERCQTKAQALSLTLDFRQSNHEGHLIDWLHEAGAGNITAVILNAGAYTHTSIALRDAIKSIKVPVIEVHLSNPAARESFRHVSHISPVAAGVIQGFGAQGYALALDAAATMRQSAR